MSMVAITALVTSVTGLVAAIGGVVALLRHAKGPQHSGTTQPPAAKP